MIDPRTFKSGLLAAGLVVAVWTAAAAGCAVTRQTGGDGGGMRAETLLAAAACGPVLEQAGAVWVTDADAYDDLVRRLSATTLSLAPQPGEGSDPRRPDFPREGALLLTQGRRPTAGFGLSLAGEPFLEDDVLVVPVRWLEPDPDAMVAQVLTHPCLLIRLQTVPFRYVRAVDESGRTRFEVSAKPPGAPGASAEP